MGQGFSLATPSAGSAGIDIAQLQDVQYEKSIGNARFMKSIRGRTEHGVVLVKVLVKPYSDVKLEEYKKQIIGEQLHANGVHCLPDRRTDASAKSSERRSPTSQTSWPFSVSSRLKQTVTLSGNFCTALSTTA
jgi:hypothetical protein